MGTFLKRLDNTPVTPCASNQKLARLTSWYCLCLSANASIPIEQRELTFEDCSK